MISVFKTILVLNLFFININSADLPEHEKKKLIEVTQKDEDNLKKIVDALDKPELQLTGDQKPQTNSSEEEDKKQREEHAKLAQRKFYKNLYQQIDPKALAVLAQKEFTSTELNVGQIQKLHEEK